MTTFPHHTEVHQLISKDYYFCIQVQVQCELTVNNYGMIQIYLQFCNRVSLHQFPHHHPEFSINRCINVFTNTSAHWNITKVTCTWTALQSSKPNKTHSSIFRDQSSSTATARWLVKYDNTEKVICFVIVLQDSFPVTKLHVSGQDLALI